MADYLTIRSGGEGVAEFCEKRSRFIAYAYPVASEEEARARVGELQSRYHDARHVCWAMRLGASGERTLANDNGEPSGTAGRPILGQMVSRDVTNVVVAVVRYFGGVKLGPSALIAAYRTAAAEALDAASIVKCTEKLRQDLVFGFESMDKVMKVVKRSDIEVVGRQSDNLCRLTVEWALADDEDYRRAMTGIEGLTIDNVVKLT